MRQGWGIKYSSALTFLNGSSYCKSTLNLDWVMWGLSPSPATEVLKNPV